MTDASRTIPDPDGRPSGAEPVASTKAVTRAARDVPAAGTPSDLPGPSDAGATAEVESAEPGSPAGSAGPARATARTLAMAGLVVTIAFAISRVLGYVRLAVIGNQFGLDRELDAFYAAFRIPDLLFQLVAAGALSTSLIPLVSGLLATDEERRAWRLVSSVGTLMTAALVVLSLLVVLAAPVLVPAFTPGFDAAEQAQTVELTRVMLLSPLFLALGSLATSVLNARGGFGASAIAPIAYNLAIIGGAVILGPTMGVLGLAVAVVAGSVAHLLVQLPALRHTGFRGRLGVDLRDPLTLKAFALMAPRAIGLGGAQVTFLVMTTLATTLPSGSVAAFTFAFTLLQIPIGVVGVPLGIVLLPSLSQEAALGDLERFRHLLLRALRLVTFVMAPLTTIGIVLADEAVVVLFGHGDVSDAALTATGVATAAFLVGLLAHTAIALLARAFYAQQDTVTPVVVALAVVALDWILALLLVGPLGLTGLALAIALGAWVEALALAVLLRRRVAGLGFGSVVSVGVRSAAAAIVAGAVAFGVDAALTGALGPERGALLRIVDGVAAGLAGGLTYLALSRVLRIDELSAMLDVMTDVLRRRSRRDRAAA